MLKALASQQVRLTADTPYETQLVNARPIGSALFNPFSMSW